MLNRFFIFNQRPGLVLASLCLTLFVTQPAHAALQKYDIVVELVSQYFLESPKAAHLEAQTNVDVVALIDESGANPILKKYKSETSTTVTLIFPQLGGFVFVSQASTSGMAADQVGTGATASSINWGNTDGWTTSGGSYCHAIPSLICILGQRVDLETIQAPNESTNFDYGTWVFHGTGFTQPGGFISSTGITALGNRRTYHRGVERNDGTVPAIPLLGIGTLGASLVAMSAAAIRRRK